MRTSYCILRVIHSLRRETGGPVAGLAETTPILTKAGIESEFAVLDGVVPLEAPFSTSPVHVFNATDSYGNCQAFADWLDGNIAKYDAVFIHGCWKYHGVAVRVAALKHGVPYFLYPHGMLDPWFNRRYPLKWIKKQIYWWLREYRVLRDARAVLFTSMEEMRLAARAFVPYRAEGKVVPYGTSTPNPADQDGGDRFRREQALPPDMPYVLYLGRVHEKKGIDMLIDAWKQWKASSDTSVHKLQLIIAGPDGPPSYESLIEDKMKACPDIRRVGGVFGRSKWSALSGAVALVLPSHQENFGMVVAEALSVGTPVFLTKQVNIWREVVAAKAGHAEDDTAEGLLRLLTAMETSLASAASSAALSDNALACYRKYFCVNELGSAFKAMFESKEMS